MLGGILQQSFLGLNGTLYVSAGIFVAMGIAASFAVPETLNSAAAPVNAVSVGEKPSGGLSAWADLLRWLLLPVPPSIPAYLDLLPSPSLTPPPSSSPILPLSPRRLHRPGFPGSQT